MIRFRRRNDYVFLDLHKLIFLLLIIRLLLCCLDVNLIRHHIKANSPDRRRGTYSVWTVHFIPPKLVQRMKRNTTVSTDNVLPTDDQSSQFPGLQEELDKWTILLTISDDYFDFFQNWWWFFVRLNLEARVLVIAEDGDVFRKIMSNYADYAYVERTDLDLEEELFYNTDNRKKIAFSRISHILRYLENGTNILYSDVDTVWLKSPFMYFTGGCDMWIQMEDESIYSTGFMAILSNKRTLTFMQRWRQILKMKLQDDRPVFNVLLKYIDVRPCPLDEKKFASGPTYKSLSNSERVDAVIVHNTNFELAHWMKLERFKQWNLWNNETRIYLGNIDSLADAGNTNSTSDG